MLADILSIVAIVLSVVSFGWQVVTWHQSGPVVAVTAGQTFLIGNASIIDRLVDVTAINKGRAPITVRGWGFRLSDGRRMAIIEASPHSASLPHRLEPGADASWYVDTKTLTDSCARQGIRYQELVPFVILGDGRTVYPRRHGFG